MSRICVVCSSVADFARAIRAWSSAKNTAEPKRAAASSSRSGKLEASSTEATPCRSNSWNRALEKRHRADFDAFPRPRVRRRGRILEGGVRGPAGAAVFYRIEYFEHVGLFTPHAREPIPFVCRIVPDRIGLADASGRTPL